MVRLIEVVNRVTVNDVFTTTGEGGLAVHKPHIEGGASDYRFEGGAWRIEPLCRPVEQRAVFTVIRYRFPLFTCSGYSHIRVIPGTGCHRKDRPGCRVKCDDGPSHPGEGIVCDLLQPGVHGNPD